MAALLMSIDPGAISGAFAVFFNDRYPMVDDLPVVDKQIDAVYLSQLIREVRPPVVVVERVSSMPKQGVASTFKFGMAVGIIHASVAAAHVPMHLITPQVWKRGMKLLGTDKDAARALAIRLFPRVEGLHRKRDVGRADALLMGHYWMLENKPHRAEKGVLWDAGMGEDYD